MLSLNLRPGSYLLTGKVNVYVNAGGYGECWLNGPAGHTLDYGYSYDSGSGGDGEVVNTAVVRLGHTGTVQLNCIGSSANADEKKLEATSVASVTDLTGANVAKVHTPRSLLPKG